tara:strand:+ start:35 stop:508 length:474 start_codon:yes stop_codon:yes gene_type:complete
MNTHGRKRPRELDNLIKMKHLLVVSSVCAILCYIFYFPVKNTGELLLTIKSNADSTLELSMCSVIVLKNGGVVEDTFADINGQYFIPNIEEVYAVVFSYTAYYPTLKSISSLKVEPILYLKRSEIIYKSGGAEGYLDLALIKEKERIDSLIDNWKLK